MAPTPDRPDGVTAWILDDDDRTRRARSLAYVAAPFVVAAAAALVAVLLVSPVAGSIAGALLASMALRSRHGRAPSRLPRRQRNS